VCPVDSRLGLSGPDFAVGYESITIFAAFAPAATPRLSSRGLARGDTAVLNAAAPYPDSGLGTLVAGGAYALILVVLVWRYGLR